jgi:hypothetical protein
MRTIRVAVVVGVVAVVLGLMGSAFAQSAEQPPDQVQPNIINRGGNGDDVLGTLFPGQERGASTGALPFTGADLALYVGAGAVAIAGGAVLVRRTRSLKARA